MNCRHLIIKKKKDHNIYFFYCGLKRDTNVPNLCNVCEHTEFEITYYLNPNLDNLCDACLKDCKKGVLVGCQDFVEMKNVEYL